MSKYEWIKFSDRMPDDGREFWAKGERNFCEIRTTNRLHRRADESGIFTPALYGRGCKLECWRYVGEGE